MLLKIIRFVARLLPPRLPEVVYTVVLRPKPLRRLAHIILLKVIPQSVEIDRTTLYLNPSDPVLSSALAFGIYENYEREVFGQFCRDGATVVDIGANIGLYTVIAAARVGRTGMVVSIEPHLESFQLLEKTIQSNSLAQIRGFNVAAGDSRRTVDLFLTDENKADSRIYDESGKRTKVTTGMVDLDYLLAANGIDQVQVIKMDIQGAEGLALRGMAGTLAKNPNIALFTEFWPWGLEQTGESSTNYLRELLRLGFRFKEIDEHKRCLRDVDNVEELIARHDKLQYTGVDFRRSHTNLICIKGALLPETSSDRADDTFGTRDGRAEHPPESNAS